MQRRAFFVTAAGASALILSGCDSSKKTDVVAEKPVDESKLRPLKVLLVDDAEFGEKLARDWKSTSQRPFTVENVSAEALQGMKELAADAVIYPPTMLGELAESGRIAALDERTLEKPELARGELIDLARLALGNWGKQVFGIPLSAPHLILAYRGEGLTAPKTWSEYDELCKSMPSERPAALEPLAKESRSMVLLTRAASRARGKNQHSTLFDVTTMKALIAQPPFVRALEELTARVQGRADEALVTSVQNVYEQVASGKASIGLTWPSVVPVKVQDAPPKAGEETKGSVIRFAIAPGSRDYYTMANGEWSTDEEVRQYPVLGGAGRLVSAIRGKLGLRDSANLVVLLAGKSRAESLAAESKDAFPCRQSQLAKQPKWLAGASFWEESAKQFAETVVDSLTSTDYLLATNLPGADRYTAALDEAIELAVTGKKSAQDSLTEAAGRWDEITKEIGLDKQKLSYLRSLGLEEMR